MAKSPSVNRANGRDRHGRFAKGNSGGPGNPHAMRVNKLRALLLAEIGERDLKRIVRALVRKARRGNLIAIREVLDRTIGKCVSFADLREVEQAVAENKYLRLPWEATEE